MWVGSKAVNSFEQFLLPFKSCEWWTNTAATIDLCVPSSPMIVCIHLIHQSLFTPCEYTRYCIPKNFRSKILLQISWILRCHKSFFVKYSPARERSCILYHQATPYALFCETFFVKCCRMAFRETFLSGKF